MINPPSETVEQQTVVQWLKIKKITFTSMPNENRWSGVVRGLLKRFIGEKKANALTAKIVSSIENSMKREGKQKGYPDLIIDEPNKYYHGLRIELKRARKQLKTKLSTAHTKISDEQKEWIRKLNERGYKAVVCYGAKEAIEVINEYMGNVNSSDARYSKLCKK